MSIRGIYYRIKQRYKLRTFKKKAILGANFNCTYNASCLNAGGKQSNIVIGDNCEICGSLIVDQTGRIKIGDYTTIRYSTSIESTNSIIIDDHVIISNNVIIRDNNTHPTNPQERYRMSESGFESELWQWKYSTNSPIHIMSNVWIGERVLIYKGVTIGRGSIIAGGSVVTKSIPDYCIAAGNPARIVKRLEM